MMENYEKADGLWDVTGGSGLALPSRPRGLRAGLVGDDLAVVHGDHAAGAGGEGLVVGDHDDGLAGVGEELEDFGDFFAVGAVEISGWFIGEDDGGLVGEGAGDGDALLLAAGEAVGFAFEFLAQAELFEEESSAIEGGGLAEAAEFEHGEGDVFLGGEFLEEVVELEDEADFFVAEAGEVGVVELHGVFAADEDAAGGNETVAIGVGLGGAIEAAEEIEEGAFAGAAGADDGNVLAVVDFQIDAFEDVVDGVAGAEELVEVLGAEEGRVGGGLG